MSDYDSDASTQPAYGEEQQQVVSDDETAYQAPPPISRVAASPPRFTPVRPRSESRGDGSGQLRRDLLQHIPDDTDRLVPTPIDTQSLASTGGTGRTGTNIQFRRKHWCVTIQSAGEAEANDLRDHITRLVPNIIQYAVFQVERPTGAEQDHIQAYIEFRDTCTPEQVKRLLGLINKPCWLTQRQRDRQTAANYCKKARTRAMFEGAGPFEYGQMHGVQGKRNDIDDIIENIDRGCSWHEVYANFPKAAMRMPAGIQRMIQARDLRNAPVDRDVKTTVFYGSTGSGKTRAVMQLDPEVYIVDGAMSGPQGQGVWFDGYTTQPAILLDDYNNWFGTSTLLRYLDRYKVQLPIKGGSAYAFWKRVYITSNIPPHKWKDGKRGCMPIAEHKYALYRRLYSIYDMQKDITYIIKHKGRYTCWGYAHGYVKRERKPSEEVSEEDEEYAEEELPEYNTQLV